MTLVGCTPSIPLTYKRNHDKLSLLQTKNKKVTIAMTHTPAIILSLVSVVLAAAVTLSSVHASHVIGLASPSIDTKKSLHEDTSVKDSKVTPDLHHHTDKQ